MYNTLYPVDITTTSFAHQILVIKDQSNFPFPTGPPSGCLRTRQLEQSSPHVSCLALGKSAAAKPQI